MNRIFSSIFVLLAGCGASNAPASAAAAWRAAHTQPFANGLDTHVHVGEPSPGDDFQFTPERALLAERAAGLSRAWILAAAHSFGTSAEHAEQQNRFVVDQARRSPENLVPFCAVPIGPDWSVEVARRGADYGCRGLKLHPMASQIDVRSEDGAGALHALLAVAEEKGLVVLIHSHLPREGEAQALLSIVSTHSQTRIVLAHALGTDFRFLQSELPAHLFVEISAAAFFRRGEEYNRGLVDGWRRFGMHRVLFGSDWPVITPSETLAKLYELRLTDDEIEQIVSSNARAFDDLFAPR